MVRVRDTAQSRSRCGRRVKRKMVQRERACYTIENGLVQIKTGCFAPVQICLASMLLRVYERMDYVSVS